MRSELAQLLAMSLTAFFVETTSAKTNGGDVSGTWTATRRTPATIAASPEPLLGQQIALRQDGERLTVIRWVRDAPIRVTYPLDGSDVRSRIPGSLCMGDSEAVETAARDGNTIILTLVGRVPPGGGPSAQSSVKRRLRLEDPNTLVVEGTVGGEATKESRNVATIYRRTSSATPSVPAPPASTTPATISQMSWLSGVWLGASGSDERWTPAAGGSMLGIGRTMRDGVMGEFEFLCITERNGSLIYQAMPNGRSPATDFILTHVDGRSARFENPTHDFPKAIRYTLQADGTLEAIVSSGPKERGITLRFKRERPRETPDF